MELEGQSIEPPPPILSEDKLVEMGACYGITMWHSNTHIDALLDSPEEASSVRMRKIPILVWKTSNLYVWD